MVPVGIGLVGIGLVDRQEAVHIGLVGTLEVDLLDIRLVGKLVAIHIGLVGRLVGKQEAVLGTDQVGKLEAVYTLVCSSLVKNVHSRSSLVEKNHEVLLNDMELLRWW